VAEPQNDDIFTVSRTPEQQAVADEFFANMRRMLGAPEKPPAPPKVKRYVEPEEV
jgi:hypothetical protein